MLYIQKMPKNPTEMKVNICKNPGNLRHNSKMSKFASGIDL